ncbi:uncharacterized protein LOC144905573 [Branchiostoma floridae x Branchiostoma belcheri]
MAAAPSSTTDRHRILEDFLSCGICFEPFTKPKALPCQHTFCLRCLETQHKKWLEDCRRTPRQEQQPFRCSICREPVTLTSKGVAGLPDNHLVSNLCEEFSKKTQVEGQKNRCGFHPTKEVDLFCQQCEVPVCSECIGDGHSGHNITGVKQVASKIKANIRAQLKKGQQKMEAFSTFLKNIQDVQKRLTDNKTQTQQQINRAFEEQVQKLQRQRDGLLAAVDKTHQDNMTALIGPRDTVLTQLAELSRVCEGAEKRLEQEEAVWLSQDLNLGEKLAKFENTQIPEVCETKLCSFEPKKSGLQIELGKVTSKPMSNKQSLVQSKETSSGETRSANVRPIRVGQPWVRKVWFGGWGSGRGKFRGPHGVAVSQDHEVYVADLSNRRIQVFTMDGVYIRQFTTTLPGETGETFIPHDVAVDRNDNLWVVGDDHVHVVQYSREGTCLATIDLPYLYYFRGITVSMLTEQVIVTEYDNQNCRLRVFNQDGSEVGTYGSGHRSPGPWSPRYVTVDGEGNILVTDDNNHCVHVLDREGNFKFKFGSEGSDESQLKNPQGICVDGKGNIIVVDSGNGCVKMFDSQGRFLCYIGSGMGCPYAVTVSPGHNIFDHFTISFRAIPENKKPTHLLFLPKPSDLFQKTTVKYTESKKKVVLSIGGVNKVERVKGYDLAAKSLVKVAETSCNIEEARPDHDQSLEDLRPARLTIRQPVPDLPVHVTLGTEQSPPGVETDDVYISKRIKELERTLFTIDVLKDPRRYKEAQQILLTHKAFLKEVLKANSFLLLLTFLRQTDVDRFYHNHYRVGEGTLSQQLSHILISDDLQDKVKGAQLIVRLHVKHEDYVRVRDRLGQGLNRTTSADNLLVLPPPSRHVDRSSLRGLDLAVIGQEDQPCTDRTDDIIMLYRQVQLNFLYLLVHFCLLFQKTFLIFLCHHLYLLHHGIYSLPAHLEMGAGNKELLTAEQPMEGACGSQQTDPVQTLSDRYSMGSEVQIGIGTIRVGQPWVRKVSFGGGGSGRGEFHRPFGVAVSQDNEVYIADWLNRRIQVFTMDGVYIREFTTTLPGRTGEKLGPEDVAVDRNDNLWVVSKDHVVQYSREGTCLVTIDLLHVLYPRGITVSMATEQVIVTEYDGHYGRLRVFNQDGSRVGTYGSGHRSPELWFPRYVTVDGEGNILVTDGNNHCVHVLDREGNFKFKFRSEGSDESQLKNPRGICVDGMGNIIVADYRNGCVKMFDSQGRFLSYIGSDMKYPWAVTVSPGGDVVVTDFDNHTVSVWTQD